MCSTPARRPDVGKDRAAEGCCWTSASRILATRRRHSFLCGSAGACESLKEGLGGLYRGTFNVLLAMDSGSGSLGTNAHELPMALCGACPQRCRPCSPRPIKVLEDLEKPLWRQLADRGRRMPSALRPSSTMRRTGLTGPGSAGQRSADRGRPRIIALVEGTRPRSAREAADLFRWSRYRDDRRGTYRTIFQTAGCARPSAGGPTSPTTSRTVRRARTCN